MFNKLTCKNGKVYLCTDLGEKLETINDINLIDIAKLDNDLEVCDTEKDNLNDAINVLKNRKKTCINISIICAILFLGNLFLEQTLIIKLFVLISNALSISISCFRTIPDCNKRINGMEQTIKYVEKKQGKINEEKEKLSKVPKYAIIREGQEFDIRFDKDIPKIFEMIYSYYINKKKIDETYEFFELCGYGEQFIRTLYSAFNRIDNRLINEKSMDEVIDEIYANMPKTKSKTK